MTHIVAMPVPAIKVERLVRHFGDVVAVDGLDFEVAPGRVVALLGGNGAGKTTTISMLLGLLMPTSGAISILGEDMLTRREDVLPRLNFSSPYVDLPRRLSVRQNLHIYAVLYGVRDWRARVGMLAEELGFAALLDRETGTLSSGQRTRVTLAKSLLNEPELLLLDEPTASLDPDTADIVRGYLEAYCRRSGAAILLASHNMGEVERLCDEVLMMRAGRIVDRGAPVELVTRYGRRNMEEVFLHIARASGAAAA